MTKLFRAILFGALALIACILVPTALRINNYTKTTMECRGNPNCLQSMTFAIGGSIRAATGAVAKAAPTVAESVKQMSSSSAEASKQTVELTKQATTVVKQSSKVVGHLDETVVNANGLVSDARVDLRDLHGVLGDIQKGVQDLQPMLQDGDQDVKKLGQGIDAITALVNQFQGELKSGSQDALGTLAAIRKLAEDPNWEVTLGHIEAASGSGAEIFKTVDLSTRFLRKKVGQLRYLLTKILEGVKFVIPFGKPF
jgi:prefoldin subunit 5